MLIIKKVDDFNIDIIVDDKLIPSSSVYYVEAHSGRIVLKNKANGQIEYSDDFKNIQVQSEPDGEPQSFSSPKEAKEALNAFIGNFSQGGENLPTPLDSPMSIPEKYVFPDDYTRDAYFAAKVSEIRSGIFVACGDVVQFYNGDYWINTSDPDLSDKLNSISSATDLLLNKLAETPISESAYNALTPEEQNEKNYIII
ncbi:MAG: hypothetical protein LBJ72_03765 [Dysgonamonadaceae bacterium]|jgi:hypothetical protein|nr:hypothetical protein [Dysgonamonadaceae bacterium]